MYVRVSVCRDMKHHLLCPQCPRLSCVRALLMFTVPAPACCAAVVLLLLFAPPPAAAVVLRSLFLMGQLCRYGADILDAAAAKEASQTRSCAECLEMCVR